LSPVIASEAKDILVEILPAMQMRGATDAERTIYPLHDCTSGFIESRK